MIALPTPKHESQVNRLVLHLANPASELPGPLMRVLPAPHVHLSHKLHISLTLHAGPKQSPCAFECKLPRRSQRRPCPKHVQPHLLSTLTYPPACVPTGAPGSNMQLSLLLLAARSPAAGGPSTGPPAPPALGPPLAAAPASP